MASAWIALAAACISAADPDSGKAAIVRIAKEDPKQAIARVVATDDPTSRLVYAGALIEHRPELARKVCGALEVQAEREWCLDQVARPHLRSPLPQATPEPQRSAQGPVDTVLCPPSDESVALPVAARTPGRCVDVAGEQLMRCVYKEARLFARSDPESALAACGSLEADLWRGECAFRAAEAATREGTAEAIRSATDLCVISERYTCACLAHVALAAAALGPSADIPDARRWKELIALEQALLGPFETAPESYRDLLAARFWSDAMVRAYGGALTVTGDPLDHLPKAAHPHVRAAAAFRLLRDEGPGDRSLSEWVEYVGEALSRRGDREVDAPWLTHWQGANDLWRGDRRGDEEIPATLYLSTARRAVNADPEADIAVCVLEGAVRIVHPASPADTAALARLLADGGRHDDPIVRWTAERLLSLDPDLRTHSPNPPLGGQASKARRGRPRRFP